MTVVVMIFAHACIWIVFLLLTHEKKNTPLYKLHTYDANQIIICIVEYYITIIYPLYTDKNINYN